MPQSASAQTASGKVVLYASVGPALTQYDVDVEGAELFRRSTATLPANVEGSMMSDDGLGGSNRSRSRTS